MSQKGERFQLSDPFGQLITRIAIYLPWMNNIFKWLQFVAVYCSSFSSDSEVNAVVFYSFRLNPIFRGVPTAFGNLTDKAPIAS